MRRAAAAIVIALAGAPGTARAAGGVAVERARVVVLDDGEKIARDASHALPASPWPPWPGGAIDLFALRGETLALQIVIEAGDAAVDDARAIVEPLATADGTRLDVDTAIFVERFIVVERPSGNDREPGSLAFTAKGAPRASYVGAIADPLVPIGFERARVAPHERGALWIDLTVPESARPGAYRGAILVRDARGELAERPIELLVLDALLPFAAAPAFVYYDTRALVRRMGDARAEPDLRALVHAHHLAAIHDLAAPALTDAPALERDHAALTGEAYAPGGAYRGPGAGVGEGVVALGAYGSLGEPSLGARDVAERLARALFGGAAPSSTAAFLYAVDEDCASDWPARWLPLAHASDALRGVRVAATCGDDPSSQAADLVLQPATDFDPSRARAARHGASAGQGTIPKWVWAYNGRRPWAGAMMLDVPATDLRANAWIAMRYAVPRWFYWESTFWFDGNRGGRGGDWGFDPFVVAETFHNADGDHANGDGILLYPGTQPGGGRVDFGAPTVFPSVRLKALRRGIEDAGYIALARAADPGRADAVVRRMVPRALARAGDRPSWPDEGRPWLDARRELAHLIVSRADPTGDARQGGPGDDNGRGAGEPVSESCALSRVPARGSSARGSLALFILVVGACAARANRSRRSRVM